MIPIALIFSLAAGASASGFETAVQDAFDQVRAAGRSLPRAMVAVSAADRPVIPIPEAYQEERPLTEASIDDDPSCVQASLNEDGGFIYCVNETDYRAITLRNEGSPRINPKGGSVHRDYTFFSARSSRQETGLTVYEWGSTDPGANDSVWSMVSEIIFLPRLAAPSVRYVAESGAYEVTIPTGEKVRFDAKTKEILGGVLKETAPIDTRADRFSRAFAGLKYSGRGVMIRSDQRGDTPRSAVVWGVKKTATAIWGAKTCELSPSDIWKQDSEHGGGDCLYANDADFYAMLRRRCRWDIRR